MASDGSHGPKPWKQKEARTVFLRVPAPDWPAVSRGVKREFRAASGQVSGLQYVEPPTPVVAYAIRGGEHKSALMVLEKRWIEPLGAITEESLKAEGYATFEEFRRYWMRRERRRFRPTRDVTCYRLRPFAVADPFDGNDQREFADRLLKHLYGEWL